MLHILFVTTLIKF